MSDTTAPTVTTAPTPSLVAGTTVEGGIVPVNVAWSVSADSFVNVLQRSNDGAPYETMEYAARRFWPAGVKQSLRRPLTGVSYRYRIEPSDAAGNIGTAVAGPAWQVGVVQDNNASLQYAGDWALGSSPKAFDGSQRFTTKAGASATLQFTGRSVAWITPRSSGRAHVRVYVDGELAGNGQHRREDAGVAGDRVRPQLAVSGPHTLKIVAVGDHRIDVDAVAVLERDPRQQQLSTQPSPRHPWTPSRAATAAIASAASGSAHHHPNSAFAPSPARSAIDRYAQSMFWAPSDTVAADPSR